MNTALHTAALEYSGKGWAVFPCQPRGKKPACARGFHDAVANDPARINTWWGIFPDLNIGIATGAVSGFFVLDIDDDEGEASLCKLEEQHGALPATVEAVTGKGRHCYFRIGEHGAVKNSVGQIAPGLDIRGDGGYVLAPPSIHPNGRAYTWSVDAADSFADAPDWLHALVHADRAVDGAKGKSLEHWHRVLTNPIPQGTKSNTLTSICGKLIHAGLTDVMLLLDLMQCINIARCVPPAPPADVEDIVASVLRGHLKRLRGDA